VCCGSCHLLQISCLCDRSTSFIFVNKITNDYNVPSLAIFPSPPRQRLTFQSPQSIYSKPETCPLTKPLQISATKYYEPHWGQLGIRFRQLYSPMKKVTEHTRLIFTSSGSQVRKKRLLTVTPTKFCEAMNTRLPTLFTPLSPFRLLSNFPHCYEAIPRERAGWMCGPVWGWWVG